MDEPPIARSTLNPDGSLVANGLANGGAILGEVRDATTAIPIPKFSVSFVHHEEEENRIEALEWVLFGCDA